MADRAREVTARGYTVLPGLLGPDVVADLEASLTRLWRALGEPALYAEEDRVLGDGAHVSPVGLALHGLLARAPRVASALLLQPAVLALLEEVLGSGFELEQVTGVVTDHSRPFFFWHNHVGGIDGEDFRGRPCPPFERSERLVCTFYGTPLDDVNGTMLVSPRAVADPTAPPYEPGREPWPGAAELRAAAGSAVVLEQSTWHAVTPMARPGRRFFAAFFARRAGLPPTAREDRSIAPAMAADPELARAWRWSRARGGATPAGPR